MIMTGRERLLIALKNGKPDRLPCLIHAWVDYHLKNTMKGMDQFKAYDCIGMDPVIYVTPKYINDDKDLAHWRVDHRDLGVDADGNRQWTIFITTPDGVLTAKGASNEYTGFEHGNPRLIREMVFKLHACCPNGGYICAPSDQFFHGSIENLRAFTDACRECFY